MSLDDVTPSLVAHSYRWGPVKRQAAFFIMAEVHAGAAAAELALRFSHYAPFTSADPLARLGAMLDALRAKDLMRAMLGEVPNGLLGAMERLGYEPMSDPAWYQTLIRLYRPQMPADRVCTRVLGQITGKLVGGQIEAVSLLDPVLLHPHVLSKVTNGTEARKLNLAVAYVRSRCSTATDIALGQSIERIPADLSMKKWLGRWAARFDRLPDSAPDLSGDPTLKLICTGAALVDAGRRYKNCLASKIGEVITGRYAFVEYRPSDSGVPGVLAELRYTSRGYVLDGLYAHSNGMVRKDVATVLRIKLARCGVAIRAHAPGQVDKLAAAASYLGVWGWRHPDIETWDEIEEEVEP
ncbi:hypothetical protein [Methylobacterium sp. 37f]|uniref:hypothetical protein n=1 Tax=Methylobacterium sp. 37f TaxID=2817058 RepID=UPI001FFD2839|nr:hypothetical protein [Methylobacterium sp. 37f]MCK2055316.1 hypothetical protein [Methylobacterium sp. 37f]